MSDPCTCARGRPVPHSLEFERLVLGGVIADPSRLPAVLATGLTAPDFYDMDHGRLWAEVILPLAEEADADPTGTHPGPTDLVIGEQIMRLGRADRYGGYGYVLGLSSGWDGLLASVYYARRVRDLAERRRALATMDYLEEPLRMGDLAATLTPEIAACVALLRGVENGEGLDVGGALRALLGDDRAAWVAAFRTWGPPDPAKSVAENRAAVAK